MSSLSRAFLVLFGVGLTGVLAFLQSSNDAFAEEKKIVLQAPKPVVVALPAVPVAPVPVKDAEKDKDKEGREEFAGVSLPTDRKAKKSLEAAEDFIKEKDWAGAVYILQSLLDSKQDMFVEVKRKSPDGKSESSHWTSIRSEANRLLGEMPANGLEVYELQYGAKAKEYLQEAKKPPEDRRREDLKKMNEAEILAEVAHRYLHTESGAEATNLLGTQHLQYGRTVMASLCFERLLSRQNTKVKPLILLKAAIAFHKLGDKANTIKTWQRLAKASPGGVLVGTKNVPLDELRKELDKVSVEELAMGAFDWLLYKGNTSRSAQGIGGTPFLDEDVNKWVQPTIREAQTKQWVEQAVSYQESRQASAVLPAFFPIAAGNKLIYRSYSGVNAVDLETGKLVWESVTANGMDNMLSRTNPSAKIQVTQWMPQYQQGGHQSILYENSTLGILSTDNNLVYAIDDMALPPHPNFLQQFMWGGKPNFGDVEDAVNCNKLCAIELATGKIKWELGGREGAADSKKAPHELNDSFFLGAPLPLGGKLYALVEKNAELRLVCLNPLNNGEVLWSQTLAAVRDRLPNDVGRRIHAANLAYGDGVLVCPTNAGAILGVDLLSHSLVWAQPYRENVPQPNPNDVPRLGRGFPVPQLGQNLVPDWKYSAPIIKDGKVVFTAPDGSSIYCLNLRDGTRLWKANRTDDLYLAGVYNGKVVLVGKQTCRSLHLADGKPAWSLETGIPSGQGVASDKIYYLPLKSAAHSKAPEVCAIDIDTGRIVAHTKTRKKEVPGNLLFYEGKVVSQTVNNVTAYPQLKVKLEQMNALIAKNPKDPLGLTERAELRRHNGDVASAVDDLRTALANHPSETILPKTRQLLFESLTELFQRDFNSSEKFLDEYKDMCKVVIPENATPDERKKFSDEQQRRQANYLCLLAKGREKQGKLLEAFHYYMDFGGLGGQTELMTVLDQPTVKARPDVWAQGRIAAMVAQATPEHRKPLEEEIARQWKEIQGTNDTEKLRTFVSLFGSLFKIGKEARLQLAERLMEENSFLEAELQLLELRRQDDAPLAARSVEMLAKLMTRKGMMEDAAYWYRILGRDFGQVVLRDGKSGADFLNDLATDKRFLPYLDEPRHAWNGGKIGAREEHGQFQPTHQTFYFEPEGEIVPFFHQNRLAFNMNLFQIKMIDRHNNEERWSQNLARQNNGHLQYLYLNQQNPNAAQTARYPYHVQGHMALFNLGLMVYCFDLVDRKVLWEKNLFGNDALPMQQIVPNPLGGLNAMYPDGHFEKIGQVGPFEPGYVCLITRQGLVCLDPLKGNILWIKSDVSASTHIFGDSKHLFMVDVQNDGTVSNSKAVRAHDGVSVDVSDFASAYQNRLHVLGRNLIVSEKTPKATVLRLYDVLTGKDIWKKEFDPKAIILKTEDTELAGVVETTNAGKLTVFDMRTQKELLHATVELKDLDKAQQVHLLRDREKFYVIVNGPANPQINPWGGPWPNLMNGMRGLLVNGMVYAFDQGTGKLKWKNEVPSQVLILEQYKDLPMLLFASRSQKLVNGGVMQVTSTKSIDKRTGKLIYDNTLLNNGTQFHTLNTNLKNGTVELISYNLKIHHFIDNK